MFEQASRAKLRFPSIKGALTVEDLWDLPLTSNTGKANLDDVARSLGERLESTVTKSYVTKTEASDDNTKLAFNIVLRVIEVRLAENEAALKAKGNREKKQQLLEILERKQNAQLETLSAEEIRAMIEAL